MGPVHLTFEQIAGLFSGPTPELPIDIDYIKLRNRSPFVARRRSLHLGEFLSLVHSAIEEEHLPGGAWIEVPIPGQLTKLIGHHDGVFWTEPR